MSASSVPPAIAAAAVFPTPEALTFAWSMYWTGHPKLQLWHAETFLRRSVHYDQAAGIATFNKAACDQQLLSGASKDQQQPTTTTTTGAKQQQQQQPTVYAPPNPMIIRAFHEWHTQLLPHRPLRLPDIEQLPSSLLFLPSNATETTTDRATTPASIGAGGEEAAPPGRQTTLDTTGSEKVDKEDNNNNSVSAIKRENSGDAAAAIKAADNDGNVDAGATTVVDVRLSDCVALRIIAARANEAEVTELLKALTRSQRLVAFSFRHRDASQSSQRDDFATSSSSSKKILGAFQTSLGSGEAWALFSDASAAASVFNALRPLTSRIEQVPLTAAADGGEGGVNSSSTMQATTTQKKLSSSSCAACPFRFPRYIIRRLVLSPSLLVGDVASASAASSLPPSLSGNSSSTRLQTPQQQPHNIIDNVHLGLNALLLRGSGVQSLLAAVGGPTLNNHLLKMATSAQTATTTSDDGAAGGGNRPSQIGTTTSMGRIISKVFVPSEIAGLFEVFGPCEISMIVPITTPSLSPSGTHDRDGAGVAPSALSSIALRICFLGLPGTSSSSASSSLSPEIVQYVRNERAGSSSEAAAVAAPNLTPALRRELLAATLAAQDAWAALNQLQTSLIVDWGLLLTYDLQQQPG